MALKGFLWKLRYVVDLYEVNADLRLSFAE